MIPLCPRCGSKRLASFGEFKSAAGQEYMCLYCGWRGQPIHYISDYVDAVRYTYCHPYYWETLAAES